MLRTLYNTLAEWLDEERTGQWEPSYESGYGKFWQTYRRVVEDSIRERLSDLLHMQYDHLFASSPDDFNDTVWEEADLVIICLEQALLLMIGSLSTDTVYKQFEALTHQTLEEEKRDAAERDAHYARMSTLTHQFWQTHFSHLQGLSLEQPQFKALRLAERLHELFPDADPQLIIAVAEIGLPGIFSNSVRDEIKAIARDLLK